jgi:hypothetical protein
MSAERDCDCPDLNPGLWHQQVHDWSSKRFVTAKAPSLFGVPVSYAGTKRRLRGKVERGEGDAGMVLIQAGKFLPSMLVEARGLEDAKPRFKRVYTELVEAPWGKIGKAVQEAQGHCLGRHGRLPRKVYLQYLSCRLCSNERGFPTLIVAALD